MSGRSGYRKTGRRRKRSAKPNCSYVLRFTLPPRLAFSVSPGRHGWSVNVGFNSVVFCHGVTPTVAAKAAADFLDTIGARLDPQGISATLLDLMPTGHPAWASADVEAVHDHISRNQIGQRSCVIDVRADSIGYVRVAQRRLSFDFEA